MGWLRLRCGCDRNGAQPQRGTHTLKRDSRAGGRITRAGGRQPGSPRVQRCSWAQAPLDVRYHDTEWGVPLRSDRRLFELLILEGAQAGLSWSTVLRKRPAYRRAFDRFDPRAVAAYTPARVRALLADPGLIRNRAKMRAAVGNARAFVAVQREHGSFSAFLWSFVDGRPHTNAWRSQRQVPATTETSRALSLALRARGFRFAGPTICYAFMQAAGLVNDHTTECFRWKEVRLLASTGRGILRT